MMQRMLTRRAGDASRSVMKRPVFLAIAIGLGGCVQVTAPDKPIEINLNVNVKQEVLVKLQRDAEQLIADNPELFPK